MDWRFFHFQNFQSSLTSMYPTLCANLSLLILSMKWIQSLFCRNGRDLYFWVKRTAAFEDLKATMMKYIIGIHLSWVEWNPTYSSIIYIEKKICNLTTFQSELDTWDHISVLEYSIKLEILWKDNEAQLFFLGDI